MTESLEQQLIDMAKNEGDPVLKELLLGTAGVKMIFDSGKRKPSGYTAMIIYTDTTGIVAMWTYGNILSSRDNFPSKDAAQKWIDTILEYWKTKKMIKKVKVESYNIGEVYES